MAGISTPAAFRGRENSVSFSSGHTIDQRVCPPWSSVFFQVKHLSVCSQSKMNTNCYNSYAHDSQIIPLMYSNRMCQSVAVPSMTCYPKTVFKVTTRKTGQKNQNTECNIQCKLYLCIKTKSWMVFIYLQYANNKRNMMIHLKTVDRFQSWCVGLWVWHHEVELGESWGFVTCSTFKVEKKVPGDTKC